MVSKVDKEVNINGAISRLLGGLEKRQKDVLEKRYGLVSNRSLTLAAVGKSYDITRERVRQIEALALTAVREKMRHDPDIKAFLVAAEEHLKKTGGIHREDVLLKELKTIFIDKTADQDFMPTARFILEASDRFDYGREDDDWHPHWFATKADQKKAKVFVDDLAKSLRAEKDTVLAGGKFDEYLAKVILSHKLPESVARHYLLVSKKFAVNHFGETGLSEWPEIEPRTARDWAYLVIKKEKRPIHFVELSSLIAKLRHDKKTNPQTVHNELIKDDRFVLVGRGIYGLREFNLLPGTAKEVIAHFLKEHGPLKAPELTKIILQERIFKEGTILINLQNKKYFKKLPDGRYTLSEV